MPRQFSADKQRAILAEYRELRAQKFGHKDACYKLAEVYHHNFRTIQSSIFKELEVEEYAVREKAIIDAKNDKGIDWKAMIPIAMTNFFNALYGKEELTGSQWQATKEIIARVEKNKAPSKPDDPSNAFGDRISGE